MSLYLITLYHFTNTLYDLGTPFIFFSTLFGYQFIRIFENCSCNSKALLNALSKQTRSVLTLSLFSLIGSVFFAFRMGIHTLWILIPSSLITIWYALPLYKLHHKKVSLRSFPSLKIFSIALVWSINSVLFPLQDQLSNPQVWVAFIQRFSFILVLTIPFDIRDMYKDAPNLRTLPQVLGILKTKLLGVLFILLFVIIVFYKEPFSMYNRLSDLFIILVSFVFLLKSSSKQSKYYASFWVEAIPILWAFIFVLLKSLRI